MPLGSAEKSQVDGQRCVEGVRLGPLLGSAEGIIPWKEAGFSGSDIKLSAKREQLHDL